MGKLIVVENGCVESVQNSPINHVGLLIGQVRCMDEIELANYSRSFSSTSLERSAIMYVFL